MKPVLQLALALELAGVRLSCLRVPMEQY